MSLADSRREFSRSDLDETTLHADPIAQFGQWFDEVSRADITDANAMTLATADARGEPSARIVLLKDFGPGGFTFYTNYESRKGRDLRENPRAALVFYWKELERQVRINGTTERVGREESERYFESRPLGSRLGAWISEQSRPVPDRHFLEDRLEEIRRRFAGDEVPLPEFWGGYRLRPGVIEFWQGRPNRLHDRILYTREHEGWKRERLAP